MRSGGVSRARRWEDQKVRIVVVLLKFGVLAY
jgi:hypothetical protein